MKRILITSYPAILGHENPGRHPESALRVPAMERGIEAASGLKPWRANVIPRKAARDELEAIHAPRYVDWVEQVGRRARDGDTRYQLDIDTYCSRGTLLAALYAAGSGLTAVDALATEQVDALVTERADAALCLVRPPGHHATVNGPPQGFCLLNNAAIAARYVQKKHGLGRVAVIDWDVHHGNGTQEAFYGDPSVLVVSLQRYPQWPHSGWFEETGIGEGRGYTVNIPLPIHTGDKGYLSAWNAIVAPVVLEYQPEMIILSAGYDAHRLDPVGEQWMTSAGFGLLSSLAANLASQLGVKVLAMVEGGYSLQALEESVPRTAQALAGVLPPCDVSELSQDEDPASVARHIAAARRYLAQSWRCLRPHAS